MYDAVVVGGRVAGARTAELLAKKGAKVLLIDGRKKISNPVQCTGFVSHRFLEILPDFPKKYQHNRVSKAKFHSPKKKSFTLDAKPFIVIDRGKLDDYLVEKAKEAGVEVRTGVTFEDKELKGDRVVVKTSKGKIEAKILVGADGPNSAVAGSCGINVKPEFYGIQATIEGDFDDSFAEIHFGSKVAPNYFAWLVPINKKKARIGLATKNSAYKYYREFCKERLGRVPLPDVSGAIKCGFQSQIVSDRVLLVGDAASQVKPFSGGGITYALIAAEMCAHASSVALESDRFDSKFLEKIYQRRAHKKFKWPILRGLAIHKAWQVLPDFGMDIAFSVANSTKLYKLAEKMDVDFY